MASQTHVVVFEEDNLAFEFRTARDFDDMLNQALTTTIGGMSLTCKYELDRELRIIDNLSQTVEVGKQEVSTLVSSEAAAETDNQRVRIHLFEDSNHAGGVALVLQPRHLVFVLDILNQLVLQSLADIPDFFVRHTLDSFPILLIRLVGVEVLVETLVEEFLPFGRSPCRHVNTVRNVTHVQFFREITLPNRSEHHLRYLAMQPANAVGFLACIQSESTHTELLVRTRVLATHVDELLPTDTQLARELAHIATEQTFVEVVVSGRNRRMNRIERRSADNFQCLIESQTFLLDIINQTLRVDQGSMPLVAVINLLADTQLVQHHDTADTQEILLLHAVFPVATVELVRNGAIPFAVLRNIRIH